MSKLGGAVIGFTVFVTGRSIYQYVYILYSIYDNASRVKDISVVIQLAIFGVGIFDFKGKTA